MNINLGDLSKPATVLIEKISDAISGIAKPGHIRRIAKAEADAEMIKAKSRIEISEIQERALERMIYEEGQKQENIENITKKAIQNLTPDAKPENIEKDWITNFFDQCRLTSDDEMQSLWAKILSGEANSPGTFSKRTISFVATLDKRDAELFTKLCTFCWMIGDLTPIIFDTQSNIYNIHNINFSSLTHLDDIGLISFNAIGGYKRMGLPENVTLFYYSKPTTIQFPDENHSLDTGNVLLTNIGKELGPICGSQSSGEYYNYVIEEWKKKGYIISVSS